MKHTALGQTFSDSLVQALARAIATAEGFFVAGALPQRANNPGNLMLGDVGFGTMNGKTIYQTAAAGWDALYKQVRLMLTGQSAYYKPDMSIAQIAPIYTGGDNPTAWARNVAAALGVSVETRLRDLGGFVTSPEGGATLAAILIGVLVLFVALR